MPALESTTSSRRRRLRPLALAVATVLMGATACSGGGAAPGSSTQLQAGSPTAPTTSTTASSVPTVAGDPSTSSPPSSGSAGPAAGTSAGTSAMPAATPAQACAAQMVTRLTPSEQAGQLLMVGLDVNAARTSLDTLVRTRHLGGVILLGGWYTGAATVRAATSHLAALATTQTTGGLGLFLAADQEGGNVQQLRGTGFTRFGTARQQDALTPGQLTTAATTWGAQLKSAGVNVNLAPVADTVPTSIGKANQPIGRWDRQYSSNPDRVAQMVVAFTKGMHAGGVAATVKHFPGLGRITGNTDVTAVGITDTTTTVTDPYLRPFAAGITGGADFVMVGSAIYSRIDPGVNAVFSGRVITDLLRTRMGYRGVVITDDVGAAKAVAAIPVGQRATRFIAAGGDIVLTATPSTVPTMHDAILAQMKASRTFTYKVRSAVQRVVTLKVERGLAHCS